MSLCTINKSGKQQNILQWDVIDVSFLSCYNQMKEPEFFCKP